jgi:hypothetical protein
MHSKFSVGLEKDERSFQFYYSWRFLWPFENPQVRKWGGFCFTFTKGSSMEVLLYISCQVLTFNSLSEKVKKIHIFYRYLKCLLNNRIQVWFQWKIVEGRLVWLQTNSFFCVTEVDSKKVPRSFAQKINNSSKMFNIKKFIVKVNVTLTLLLIPVVEHVPENG